MKKSYNWGIIGPGRIARKFANDLQLLPGAHLAAVASTSVERAEAFARDFGVQKVYGSYEELASDPDIDIIYIASLHTGHYRDSLLCLEHHKPVLCEKPIAINSLQFEVMASAAARNKTFFMEALWTRFVPSFVKMLDLLADGAIGTLKMIEADFCINPPYSADSRLFDPAKGGGSLLDIGIYPVFLALEAGSEVIDVKAMASLDGNGIDTACTIIMAHEKGELSLLSSASMCNGRIEALLHGSKGMLRLNKCWHVPTSLDLVRDGKQPETFSFEANGFGYHHEAAEVMQCLDRGEAESSLWSLEKSRKLIRMLDKIRTVTGIRYPDDIEKV